MDPRFRFIQKRLLLLSERKTYSFLMRSDAPPAFGRSGPRTTRGRTPLKPSSCRLTCRRWWSPCLLFDGLTVLSLLILPLPLLPPPSIVGTALSPGKSETRVARRNGGPLGGCPLRRGSTQQRPLGYCSELLVEDRHFSAQEPTSSRQLVFFFLLLLGGCLSLLSP